MMNPSSAGAGNGNHEKHENEGVMVKFKVTWLCDLTIQSPLLLPSLAPADSGNPYRNDGVGVGRLHHLKFSHYPE